MSKKSRRQNTTSRNARREQIKLKREAPLTDLDQKWMRITATTALVKWATESNGPPFTVGDEYDVKMVGQYDLADGPNGTKRITRVTVIDYIQVRQEDRNANDES